MTLNSNKLIGVKNVIPFWVGFSIGLFFFTSHILGFNLSLFPGDLGDARFNMYLLEHDYKFFFGKINDFWSAPFMFPAKDTITFSDNLLGSAPIYAFFRLLGSSRETAFQLWILIVTFLNYACTYWFLKLVFKNREAAVIGALIFTFSMGLQSQMTHAQTFPRYPISLALGMSYFFYKKLDIRYFYGAVFFVVYQFYCGIYLGFMLFIPISLLLLGILIYKRRLFRKNIRSVKWVSGMLFSIGFNLLFLWVLMHPYYIRAQEMPSPLLNTIIPTIPTVRSFFYSQKGSLFWNFLSSVGNDYPAFWDHQIFVGGMAMISLLLSFLLIIFRRKSKYLNNVYSPFLYLMLIVGFLTFAFFIRFRGYTLYLLLLHIPGFSSMRSMGRIINVELIFFAIATAFISKILLEKYLTYRKLVFIGLCCFFVLDNYFKVGSSYCTDKALAQKRVYELGVKMKHIPPGSVISYEPLLTSSSIIFYQIDAMLASQNLNLKAVNGYSGTSPAGYTPYWENPNKNTRRQWFERNKYFGSVYIIH